MNYIFVRLVYVLVVYARHHFQVPLVFVDVRIADGERG